MAWPTQLEKYAVQLFGTTEMISVDKSGEIVMSNGTHIVRDPKGQVDEVSRSGSARELAFEDAMGSYFYAENNVVYRQVFPAFKEE